MHPDQQPTIDSATRYRAVRRVLLLTLLGNGFVVALKLIAGLAAGALSVVADAVHSSVDGINNVIALALMSIAWQAPDEEHPYGHAKFETLGTLAIVAFLSITVYELVTSAFRRIFLVEVRPQVTFAVVGAMVVSSLISYLVARYEYRRGVALSSHILTADSSHTRADVLASIAVIVGLGLVAAGYPRADGVFTLVVALIIARTGWRILRGSVPILVDERAVSVETIRRIALAADGVIDAFDIRSRGRGADVFAELTITVDRSLNVEEAHGIADAVERRVASELRAREVVAHVEPAANPTPR
ncbi:MAG: cation diffusion facilitator family transporter [Longimicrobiales bacterium]